MCFGVCHIWFEYILCDTRILGLGTSNRYEAIDFIKACTSVWIGYFACSYNWFKLISIK